MKVCSLPHNPSWKMQDPEVVRKGDATPRSEDFIVGFGDDGAMVWMSIPLWQTRSGIEDETMDALRI